MVDVYTRVALARQADGRVLGQRVADDRINAGQVDLPGPGPLVGVTDAEDLQGWLDARLGAGSLRVALEPAVEVRHGITHHRIRVAVHVATLIRRPQDVDAVWASPADPTTPWTTIARKAMAKVSG